MSGKPGTAFGPVSATYSLTPSSFQAAADYFVMSDNAKPYPQYVTYTAQFDDTFYLPPAPAGDVYKVSVRASNVPPRVPINQYGASAFVQLSSEALSYDPGANGAYPGACYYHGCVFNGIIPASQITYINITGDLNAIIGPAIDGIAVGAGASASITLDLYKADGVTPDVFTPEPTSFSLFGLSGLIGAVAYCKRRRNVALRRV